VIAMQTLTAGQARIAKATAARMRASEEKLAEKLRERGWTVVPPAREIKSGK
jgi:hypothetical protein